MKKPTGKANTGKFCVSRRHSVMAASGGRDIDNTPWKEHFLIGDFDPNEEKETFEGVVDVSRRELTDDELFDEGEIVDGLDVCVNIGDILDALDSSTADTQKGVTEQSGGFLTRSGTFRRHEFGSAGSGISLPPSSHPGLRLATQSYGRQQVRLAARQGFDDNRQMVERHASQVIAQLGNGRR